MTLILMSETVVYQRWTYDDTIWQIAPDNITDQNFLTNILKIGRGGRETQKTQQEKVIEDDEPGLALQRPRF